MGDLKQTIEEALKPESELIYNGRKLEGYEKSAARIAALLMDKAIKDSEPENTDN